MRLFLIVVAIVFITGGLSAQSEKQPGRKSPNTAPKTPSTNTAEAKDRLAILQYAKEKNYKIQPFGQEGMWYEILFSGFGAPLNDTTSIKIAFDIYDLNDKRISSSSEGGKPRFLQASMLGSSFKTLIPKMRAKTKVLVFVPSNHLSFRNPEPIKLLLTILEIGTPETIQQEKEALIAEYAEQQKEGEARLANEPANIQQYLRNNQLTGFKSTADGIWYKILTPGGTARPKIKNILKVHYKGTLLDGSEFDSSYSRGEPSEFPLGGVIQGWQKAIPLLGKGGKGIFIIPFALAYGPQSPSPDIPPYSTLVFEIELLDFQ